MKSVLASVLSIFGIHMILCSASTTPISSLGIGACPFTTPVSQGVTLPTGATNCVLDKLTIVAAEAAATPTVNPANIALYQRLGPNGRKILYIQLLPPVVPGSFPQPGATVEVGITVNPAFSVTAPYIPLVYTILSTPPGATIAAGPTPDQLILTITVPADYLSVVVTIAELGYVNEANYTYDPAATTLTANFFTDIFSQNPFTATDATFAATNPVPTNFVLPTNEQSVINRIRHHLKKCAISPCVPESQFKKMAVAAFINELGSCFRSKETCCKSICEPSVYTEYITFVTSCIKTIAHCEQSKSCKVDFSPPSGFSGSLTIQVNTELCNFARRCPIETGFNAEVCTMFSEICDGYSYEPTNYCFPPTLEPSPVADLYPTPEIEELVCSTTEEEKEKEKERKKAEKAKRRTQEKRTTVVSTTVAYGWYIAGGVAVVSVAVVIYIFVL